jgi:hypothetical protein
MSSAPRTALDNAAGNKPRYWPVIAGGFAILAIAHMFLWVNWLGRTRVGYGDFSAFYCAGKMIQQGQGHDLYNLEIQRAVRKHTVPKALIIGEGLPFFHPAYEGLIYAALAYLPYQQAYLLWNALGMLMLLAALLLLRSQLGSPLNSMGFLVAGALGYFPVAEIFIHGQDDALLLVVVAAAYMSLARGRDRTAGAILALGLFKFHLILPIAVILLFQRRWRFAQGFSAGAAAVVALSIAATGLAGAQQYARLMLNLDRMPENYISAFTVQMPNIRGSLTTIFSSWAPSGATKLAVLLLSAAVILYAGKAASRRSADLKVGLSVAITAAILVSYHANIHDLSLLVFPLLFLAERLLAQPSRGGALHWTLILLLVFSPLYHVVLRCSNLLFWPILGLFVLLVRKAGEHSPEGTDYKIQAA